MTTILTRVLPLLLLAATLPAQAPPAIAGDWQGTLQAGPNELRLVLHVRRDGDALHATLDSIDQGARGLKIDRISLTDRKLEFAMPGLRASYAGVVSDDGASIAGTWTQGGELPLKFVRGSGPVLVRPQMPKPPFPYRTEEVRYAHTPGRGVAASFTTDVGAAGEGAVVLAGTLTLPAGPKGPEGPKGPKGPKGRGPFPAVVLISGSGPQDRDESLAGHKPFLVLADHLTRQGVAVLRFDDRGTAKSTGQHATATSADFADDAEAGFRYLRTRKEIAPEKIGLIGHSEGGLIAPMVAARNGDVAFLVLMAGPGCPGDEIIRRQSGLIAKASGADDATVTLADEVNARIFAMMRTEKDAAKLRAAVRTAVRDSLDALGETARGQLGDLDKITAARTDRLFTPWMRYFLTYDPRPALAKVGCPVLAINGELDLQVDPDQNLPEIEAALRRGGNKDVVIKRLPRLNHLFQNARSGSPNEYGKIEETFDPKALQVIADFVRERFAR